MDSNKGENTILTAVTAKDPLGLSYSLAGNKMMIILGAHK